MNKKIGLTIIAGGLFLNGLPVSAQELQEVIDQGVVEEVVTENEVETQKKDEASSTSEEESMSEQMIAVEEVSRGIELFAPRSGIFALEDWNYTIVGTTVELGFYKGTDVNIVIPAEVEHQGSTYDVVIPSSSVLRFVPNMETLLIQEVNGKKVKYTDTSFDFVFTSIHTLKSLDLRGLDVSSLGNTTLNQTFADLPNLTYINIDGWDLSNSTSLSSIFKGTYNLEEVHMSNIDTSSMTSYYKAFEDMKAENFYMNNWSLEGVSFLTDMFKDTDIKTLYTDSLKIDSATYNFNLFAQRHSPDMEKTLVATNWDLGNMTSLSSTFQGNNYSNIVIEGWNTTGITSINNMFKDAKQNLNVDLSDFDVSNVTHINDMFHQSNMGDVKLNGWDLQSLTTPISRIVSNATYNNLDVSDWKTASGSSLGYMFSNVEVADTLNMSNFDVNTNVSISQMFKELTTKTLDVSNWANTDRVTSLSGLLSEAKITDKLDLSGFDTSGVTDTSFIFSNTEVKDLDISNWDLSNVTTRLDDVFSNRNVVELNLSNIKLDAGYDTTRMFASMSSLQKLTMQDFDLPTGINTMNMFDMLPAKELDVANWNLGNATNIMGLFWGMEKTEELDLSTWDTSNLTNVGAVFGGSKIKKLNMSNLDFSSVAANFKLIFSLDELVELNISGLTFPDGSNYHYLFEDTPKLEKLIFNDYVASSNVNLDSIFGEMSATELEVANWDLSNVDQISFVFSGLSGAESIDLSTWDVSGIKKMEQLFSSSESLKSVNMSGWDTSNLEEAAWMFAGAKQLENIDVSHFNTTKLKDAYGMFEGTTNLKSLDLRSWDTSNLEDTASMFYESGIEELDLRAWDTSKIKDTVLMFGKMPNIKKLDLSTWDTSSMIDTRSMFRGSSKLTVLDLNGWDLSAAQVARMFETSTPTPLTVFADHGSIVDYDFAVDNRTPEFLGIAKNGFAGTFSDGTARQELTYKVNGYVMNQRFVTPSEYNNFLVETPKATVVGDYFTGWDNTQTTITQDYDLFNGSVIFNATYRNTYTIIFHDSKGDVTLHTTYGTLLPNGVPVPDAKENHTFVGWNTKPDGSGIMFDPITDVVTANLELYPIYALNIYTVEIEINGQITVLNIQHGEKIKESDLPKVEARDGYTFVGWQVLSGRSVTLFDFENDVVTSNLKLSAYFTKDDSPVKEKVKQTDGVNTGVEINAHSAMITLVTSLGLIGLVTAISKRKKKHN